MFSARLNEDCQYSELYWAVMLWRTQYERYSVSWNGLCQYDDFWVDSVACAVDRSLASVDGDLEPEKVKMPIIILF